MKKKWLKRLQNARGFTLIELMATLVILAIIVAIAVPAVGNITAKAKSSAIDSEKKLVERAADMAFLGEIGFTPNLPNDEKGYTVPDLVDNGYVKIPEESPINNDANYVVQQPDGSFEFVGTPEAPNTGTPGGGNTTPDDDDADMSDFRFDLNGPGGTARILGYAEGVTPDPNLVIPSTYQGQPVTVIGTTSLSQDPSTPGAMAFAGKGLTSVTIPSSVQSIGVAAFAQNQLKSVTIPNGVATIGMGAFFGNGMTSVSMPESLRLIGNNAFAMNALTNVSIPNGVVEVSGLAFTQNQISTVSFGSTVQRIGEDAFYDNKLTNITLPASVTHVGNRAFVNNPSLASVRIHNDNIMLGSGGSDRVFFLNDNEFGYGWFTIFANPDSNGENHAYEFGFVARGL